MKTKLCRPLLIKSKSATSLLKENGRLVKFNSNPHFRKQIGDEFQQLILISLVPDEKIEKGDAFYDKLDNKIMRWNMSYPFPSEYYDYCFKVIATQDQLHLSYIHQFIEEHNANEMRDVEILMESGIDPNGIQKLTKDEFYSQFPEELPNYVPINKPKLTDGFVTIITESDKILNSIDDTSDDGSDPILYTEEEVFALCRDAYYEGGIYPLPQLVDDAEATIKDWFEQNKKKNN